MKRGDAEGFLSEDPRAMRTVRYVAAAAASALYA